MSEHEIVIGLEVHVHLKTKTKAFCGCSTEFGNEPNSQTCPVCLGMPGSLPVLNKQFLELGIRTALALGCEIAEFTKFDRKNYYYPDLPKNYQISQYDLPMSHRGFIMIEIEGKQKKIGITRVHMEEDAGKLIHDEKKPVSYVDYNRTGMPLLEIVSEPDMSSPDEAYEYLTNLKAILRYLEVSDCDMEKGSLRCDANISIRKKGDKKLGVKTELKNMNSFKAVRQALGFEAARQEKTLNDNGKITQETLLWDENKCVTVSMRTKEEAHDYRYFPEPDLVPFTISKEQISEIRSSIPELPKERKARFLSKLKLSYEDANILTEDKYLADYFEKCLTKYNEPKQICNWIIGPVLQELNENNSSIDRIQLKPESLISLIKLVKNNTISNLAGKDVLKHVIKTGKTPEELIKEMDLTQVSDETALQDAVDAVIKENSKSVNDYKSGKENAVMFLVGQVMKKTRGKANPKLVKEMLIRGLSDA